MIAADTDLDALFKRLHLANARRVWRGLPLDVLRGTRPAAQQTIVAVYPYRSADDQIIAEKVRFSPKGFRWRTPGVRKWRWQLGEARPGLYRLERLYEPCRVYVVEGEKAVDYLWEHGLIATCGPGGAGRWSPEFAQALVDTGVGEVVVLPDADAAGAAHAELVAKKLHAVDPLLSVRVVALPGLPRRGDVVDWLATGHTVAELEGLATAAAPWSQELAAQLRVEHLKKLRREKKQRWRAPDAVTDAA